ncbi:VOC family protein [Natronobacterium gregoryi]|uniref:Fosmidomycin resistance protein n=2 Tax=Natronobacterium gregoryi TaxID=44930 RepID=L0ADW6_NATGS|nr:VOC family protein [Natronobacterium gregoryi]AFZ71342.1 putative ring-cleavage extradiol dioxygenase [Natronobacterium gregoryi SP2]ELY67044.1 glyoxalase/bleomycin resistance protein/dioxygenase [Natronobacterium gregoryi SP2]PLK21187.1 fosmidomycin resistance protein [Natronobacterium gregoryi SP2]SFI85956.1 Catechol-2,3-dioxygenase [Natronobacterium gregoryi]
MLSRVAWLALEVKHLESARAFYGETLGMATRPEREERSELVFAAGETDLVLRRPTAVPRGGLHTHFAFSIPADEYGDWWSRLEEEYDLEEAKFGSSKSLYLYDPDGNCVELGQQDVGGPGIDGIFEVVLEVEDVARAESFYADLGFETIDTGDDRTRVRMHGPMALELWEPHLGIADARGGVHVDLGFEASEPTAALEAVSDRVQQIDQIDDEQVVVRDPDGHVLTVTRKP